MSSVVEYMLRKGYSRRLSEEAAAEASAKPSLLARVLAEEEHGVREEPLESPSRAAYTTGKLASLILGIEVA
ncbi:MAG: hypothetical protein DRN96_07245 [Thermoproteota archaeon]|nr:MAG: hypothetical protein DRN96_07245 [Candidatus Korarchaeota archaeon]